MYVRQRSNPQAAFMASPSMVLSAFAIELFLKCLLLLEGKEIDRIHTLNVLYRRLSHNRKRRIEEVWEKEARPKVDMLNQQFGLGWPSDLPNALVTCARAFERMRYGYEYPDQPFYLGELPPILWRTILELRPEWATD
jgi:HEPN domain-containing protein